MGEAGFAPVILFYLSRWNTRRDLALRVSIFLFSAPMSGIINGLIAYGVSFIHGSMASWRYLFLIEGAPAVLAGVYAFFMLPSDFQSTHWLTDEEKACGTFTSHSLLSVG
jgi:MFS family permease